MALDSSAVSVGTSATALTADDEDWTRVLVQNLGSGDVYVGASDVSTTIGIKVAAGKDLGITLAPHERLYGIVASGTEDMRVLQTAQ